LLIVKPIYTPHYAMNSQLPFAQVRNETQDVTKKIISMKALIIKSIITSLFQREVINPSLEKRGKGRFFSNDALLINSFKLISINGLKWYLHFTLSPTLPPPSMGRKQL
jgi:hypothetical protein